MNCDIRHWADVPAQGYLDSALRLSEGELRELDAIAGELPSVVRDAHTHIAAETELAKYPPSLLSHVASTYPAYSLDDAGRARKVLWPKTRVQSLRMAHAIRGYNHKAINRSLAKAIAMSGDVLAVYGLPDDVAYTLSILAWSQASALKMYYAYRDPPYEKLGDVFPPQVLAEAQRLGVPIILHLPQPLPKSTDAVLNLCTQYPDLPVVLAHIGGHGGQFYLLAAQQALQQLSRVNVYVDTAFVYDTELVNAAIRVLGSSRVLFGTDEPLSLIRAVPYTHPQLGPRLYAPNYHWAGQDAPPAQVIAERAGLLHILQVRAVLEAARQYGDSAVEAVFATNAKALYGFGDEIRSQG